MKINKALFLFILVCFGSLKVQAQLNTAHNDRMPKGTVVGLADLRAFQDNPVIADGNSSFAVTAGLYNTLLNLAGTSKEGHDKMCSDEIANKIAPFITPSQDDQGQYHYSIIPGKEETVLGYSKCLDATKFRDVLDSSATQDDSNQDGTVWVYLNLTNEPLPRENSPASGYRSQQPIDGAEGEYNFYQTQDDPRSGGDQNFSGEFWVRMKYDGSPIDNSTVTGNIQNTSSDSPSALKAQEAPTPAQESNPIEATAPSANGGNSDSPQDIVIFKKIVLLLPFIAIACIVGPALGSAVGCVLAAGTGAQLGSLVGGLVAVGVAIKASLSVPIKS